MSQVHDYRELIAARFPELRGGVFSLETRGFHSVAVDVDDTWIFKFPRHDEAAQALRREARLLAAVRPAVRLPVPDLQLFDTPLLFSRHRKLPGRSLEARDYDALPEHAKAELGAALAHCYADLHALELPRMEAAGATRVEWFGDDPERILREAWPLLPDAFRRAATRAVRAWQNLPPDPCGEIYGFFDGHGWNMAFDHERQRLQGIFDFADSGIGPLHREFTYSNFISFDLTERIVREYERLTQRALDRERIFLLTGVFWLSELGGFADRPDYLALASSNVAAWMARAAR